MPVGLIAAGLSALGNVIGSGINAFSQGRQNQRSQDFSREMYERQRADGLEFWRMQNDYNSPQAQMKRFQEAGLNPNLIYGQGSSGNAGLPPVPDYKMPDFRSSSPGDGVSNAFTSGINTFFDVQFRSAQLDNLRAQNQAIQEETALKRAETARVIKDTEGRAFDLDFKSEFRDISADAARERLRQLRTNTDLAINRDARDAATNSSNLKEAVSRMETQYLQRQQVKLGMAKTRTEIASIREQTKRTIAGVRLLEQQGTLNDLEIEFRRKGLSFRDPLWSRMVAKLLGTMFPQSGLPSFSND